MSKTLVVYHSLPYKVGDDGPAPCLVPEGPGETPIRRRRSRRSSIMSASSLIAMMEGLGGPKEASPSDICEHVVSPILLHPSLRIKGEGIVYAGLVNNDDEGALAQLRQHQCIPISIDPVQRVAYVKYCDEVITQLFHYKLFEKQRMEVDLMQGWDTFVRVNEVFAEQLAGCIQPGDQVVILDHRLCLLPAMLKGSCSVAFHLGVPFPTSELIRCYPKAKELLEGLLGCDLIIFQVFSYIRHFTSSCSRLLGLESTSKAVDYHGIPVQLRVIPVGIDASQVIQERDSTGTRSKIDVIQKIFRGKKMLLGIDGIESSKGIIQKLEGFERLLETEPQWIGEVVMIQIMVAKAPDSQITEAASRINNRYGYLGFNPVQIFYTVELLKAEYFALLSLADVFVVISERAAFSIPALEYVVCQEKRYGQLILSEFIGNSVFVPNAFIANSWDKAELANRLEDALTIPIDEMITRQETMFGVICKFDAGYWWGEIQRELDAAHQVTREYLNTPPLDVNDLYRRYLSVTGGTRLFLLDYDGTIVGIRKTPEEATPSQDLLRCLRALCRDEQNVVYIISGRNKAWLEATFRAFPQIGLSAEHGCYLRPAARAGGRQEWIRMIGVEGETAAWKAAALPILQYYTERTPGSLVEEKTVSVTWHYRKAGEAFGQRQAHELQNLLDQSIAPNYPVEVITGKKNIELRPSQATKGSIVKDILSRQRVGLIVCFGDDRTDEDMFAYLREEHGVNLACFTCKVGAAKATSAKYYVRTPEQVVAILARLALASTERMLHSTI